MWRIMTGTIRGAQGVKHPKSGRNDLRFEVSTVPVLHRIWFLRTEKEKEQHFFLAPQLRLCKPGCAYSLFLFRFCNPASAYSLANVANFLRTPQPLWLPSLSLFANTSFYNVANTRGI